MNNNNYITQNGNNYITQDGIVFKSEREGLLLASEINNIEIIKYYVDAGFRIERSTLSSEMLRNAVSRRNVDVVRFLLERGANAKLKGLLEFIVHCRKNDDGDRQTMELLLEYGADVYASVRDEFILYIMRYDCVSMLDKFIVSVGVRIENLIYHGRSFLMLASSEGAINSVRLLLEKGADVNESDDRGMTALHRASCPEIVKLLLEYGADINKKNDQGETVLSTFAGAFAGGSNCTDILELLLNHKDFDINMNNLNGFSAFHNFALRRWNMDVYPELEKELKLFIDKGFDINQRVTKGVFEGKTVLDIMVGDFKRKIKIFKLLVENGSDGEFYE